MACFIVLCLLTRCSTPLSADYQLIWLEKPLDQYGKDSGKIDTLRIEYYRQKKLNKRITFTQEPYQKYTAQYDTAERVLTAVMERPDAPTWEMHQQFDRFGNYLSKDFGFNDIRFKHTTQSRLGHDSLALETRFFKQPANLLETIESYIYDENKHITSVTSYSVNPAGDTNFVSYIDKVYNPHGLLVKEQNSAGADAPHTWTTWEYDEKDRLIKYQRFSKERMEEEISFTYKGDRKVSGTRTLPLRNKKYTLSFIYK